VSAWGAAGAALPVPEAGGGTGVIFGQSPSRTWIRGKTFPRSDDQDDGTHRAALTPVQPRSVGAAMAILPALHPQRGGTEGDAALRVHHPSSPAQGDAQGSAVPTGGAHRCDELSGLSSPLHSRCCARWVALGLESGSDPARGRVSPLLDKALAGCCDATLSLGHPPQRGGSSFGFILFSVSWAGRQGSCLQQGSLPAPPAARALMDLWGCGDRTVLGELLPWRSPGAGG